MPSLAASIDIDRTPDDVFAFIAAPENLSTWRPYVIEAEWVDPTGVNGPGRRGRQVNRVLGRAIESIGTVVAWEPPHLLSTTGDMRGMTVDTFFRLEPQAGGCRITTGATAESHRIVWRLLGPLMFAGLRRQTKIDLKKLKQVLETP